MMKEFMYYSLLRFRKFVYCFVIYFALLILKADCNEKIDFEIFYFLNSPYFSEFIDTNIRIFSCFFAEKMSFKVEIFLSSYQCCDKRMMPEMCRRRHDNSIHNLKYNSNRRRFSHQKYFFANIRTTGYYIPVSILAF